MTENFAKTGQDYWGASPNYFSYYYAYARYVRSSGAIYSSRVLSSYGARGVVTLLPGTKLEDGSGTYTDPYIVGPLVTRNES